MTYARPSVAAAAGYVPGSQPTEPGYIKLNTNECPYPPSPHVVEALRAVVDDSLRLYPEPTATALREKVAEVYGFEPDEVIVGNGMDDLLSLALRTFVDVSETVVTTYPTYTLYMTLADMHGAETTVHELTETFDLPDSIFSVSGKLLLLSNPNAPTGRLYPRSEVARLCESFGGVVVVDEAYVDFAKENSIELAHKYGNVLVMRSMSKSFSLAGMRIGFAVGTRELVGQMMKVKDSYNVNRLSQVAGWHALDDIETMRVNVGRIVTARARLVESLDGLGFDIVPSAANFLLVTHRSVPARKIFDELNDRRILVRYFDSPRLDNSLRISIGTDDEMESLVEAVRTIIDEHGS